MPGLRRSYTRGRRTFRRRAKSWTRGARRYKSKTRGSYSKKKVTVRMLRQIVAKPELKYHNTVNGANTALTNGAAFSVTWATSFAIPQGTGLGNRIGDSVQLKMIECDFELTPAPTLGRTLTSVSGGAAGFGNVVDQLRNDQAARIIIVDTNMDPNTNTAVQGLEWMGSTQSNSPGGASDYNLQLDKLVLERQGRKIRKDSKYVHSKGVFTVGDFVAPSTGDAPFGIGHALYRVGEHKIIIKFPGKGYKLQFDSNATQVPVRMPVLWHCGKDNTTTNNPYLRFATIRLWFTDQ